MNKRSPFQPPKKSDNPQLHSKQESTEYNGDTVDNDYNESTDSTDSNVDNVDNADNDFPDDTENFTLEDNNNSVVSNPYAKDHADSEDYFGDNISSSSNEMQEQDTHGEDEHFSEEEEEVFDDEYFPEEEGKSGKLKKISLVTLAILLIAGIVTAWYFFFASKALGVQVPEAQDYIGYDDTSNPCEPFSSLTCSVDWQTSEDIPNGQLISQSLAAGSSVSEQTPISLTYSKGQENPIIPESIVGLTEQDARETLYALGLKVQQIVKVDDSGKSANTVVSVKPDSLGEKVANGSGITLYVATGSLEIPDWTGKTKEFVQAEAEKMNINVVFKEEESESPLGTVISQGSQGQEVNEGDAVEVVIAKAFSEEQVEIPDVLSMTEQEAQSTLASEGFRQIVTLNVKNNEVTSKQVTQITPSVGEKVGVNEKIIIVVAEPDTTP